MIGIEKGYVFNAYPSLYISQYFFQIVGQKRSQQIRISFYTLFSIFIGGITSVELL